MYICMYVFRKNVIHMHIYHYNVALSTISVFHVHDVVMYVSTSGCPPTYTDRFRSFVETDQIGSLQHVFMVDFFIFQCLDHLRMNQIGK